MSSIPTFKIKTQGGGTESLQIQQNQDGSFEVDALQQTADGKTMQGVSVSGTDLLESMQAAQQSLQAASSGGAIALPQNEPGVSSVMAIAGTTAEDGTVSARGVAQTYDPTTGKAQQSIVAKSISGQQSTLSTALNTELNALQSGLDGTTITGTGTTNATGGTTNTATATTTATTTTTGATLTTGTGGLNQDDLNIGDSTADDTHVENAVFAYNEYLAGAITPSQFNQAYTTQLNAYLSEQQQTDPQYSALQATQTFNNAIATPGTVSTVG